MKKILWTEKDREREKGGSSGKEGGGSE